MDEGPLISEKKKRSRRMAVLYGVGMVVICIMMVLATYYMLKGL